MRLQVRYRTVGWFALAISLLVLAGIPQVAGAEGRRDDSAGFGRRAGTPAAQAAAAASAPADAPAEGAAPASAAATADAGAPDQQAGAAAVAASGNDGTPGGQVCDGDPDDVAGSGGDYENTCDAGPSENGAGDGEAGGKPCAGCVGNADDKDPPGQAGGGPTDANNGYECDEKGAGANQGNNGVGVGNPAHTPCKPGTTTNPPPPAAQTCPDGRPMPASGNAADCVTVVAAGGETVVVGELLPRPETVVLGVQLSRPEVAAAPATLARTGSSIGVLVQAALVLAAFGLALTGVSRFRRRDMIDIATRLGG